MTWIYNDKPFRFRNRLATDRRCLHFYQGNWSVCTKHTKTSFGNDLRLKSMRFTSHSDKQRLLRKFACSTCTWWVPIIDPFEDSPVSKKTYHIVDSICPHSSRWSPDSLMFFMRVARISLWPGEVQGAAVADCVNGHWRRLHNLDFDWWWWIDTYNSNDNIFSLFVFIPLRNVRIPQWRYLLYSVVFIRRLNRRVPHVRNFSGRRERVEASKSSSQINIFTKIILFLFMQTVTIVLIFAHE